MKGTLSQLIRYKAFKKLALSYFLLILISVILLSSAFFSLFSLSAIKEIDRNSRTVLSQISYAADVVQDQVMTIGNTLIYDNKIVSFTHAPEEDKVKNYNIYLQLSQIKNAYPFIHSIGIYKQISDSIVDTSGLPVDRNLLGSLATKYLNYFPRKFVVAGLNGNQPYQFITFTLYPEYSLKSSANSVIYINVEAQYILNTIRNISKADSANNTFVMNSEGLILSHTDPSLFMQDLSGENYVNRILTEDQTKQSFTANINNRKYLVTYVKSDDLNWYFVSVSPYKSVISNIYELRNITLAIAGALVLAGLLISIYVTKNIYKPMSSLFDQVKHEKQDAPFTRQVDEYQVLSDAFTSMVENEKSMQFVIHRSSNTIKEHYLQALIKGNANDIDVPEDMLQIINEQLQGPYFYIIVFKMDDIQGIKERTSASQQQLLRFALGNIAKEILEEFGVCELLVTGENEVVAVGQYVSETLPTELKEAIGQIQSFLKKYFKITVSAGIGDSVISRGNIPSSYISAQQYVRYRLIYGEQSILDLNRTRDHFMSAVSYPTQTEKKLIEAVQNGKPEGILEKTGEFIDAVSSGSCSQLITYSSQLMLSLLKHFEYLKTMDGANFSDYLDALSEIETAESIKRISEIITEYCYQICSLIEESNNWLNAQKYNRIIEEVQKFICENYSTPNLSLETVAGFTGLSARYLGKLFKGTINMPFNEYLNQTRLEKARELLEDTNEPAFKISESVGIYNVTYFSTLFKKTYGLPPSQYREQIALKHHAKKERHD